MRGLKCHAKKPGHSLGSRVYVRLVFSEKLRSLDGKVWAGDELRGCCPPQRRCTDFSVPTPEPLVAVTGLRDWGACPKGAEPSTKMCQAAGVVRGDVTKEVRYSLDLEERAGFI